MGSTGVTNAYIQVAWTVVSDARDKTDFAPVPHGLDFVMELKPTAYRYKATREDTEGHGPLRYGFKAQDVLALEGNTPVIVDAEDSEKLRFNDQAVIAVLVNALQELNNKFDALIVIAAPRTLGELRKHWHKALEAKLVGEISKDLTGHSIADITATLAKA